MIMKTIDDILRNHVTLEVECIDRLYLNGYMPNLQTGGALVRFMMEQMGMRIPSPVILQHVTQGYVKALKDFAARDEIPIFPFDHKDRKDDIANAFRAERGIRDGVVFIGVAQEKAWTFQAHKKDQKGYVGFDYARDKPAYMNHYYIYLDDAEFGPGFIKVCSK